jgi:hypothetical protein
MAKLAAYSKQAASLIAQAANMHAGMLESVDALQNYLVILDGVLGSGLGSPGKRTPKARHAEVKLPVSRFRSVVAADAPPSVHEGVLIIMKDLGKPVLPKEVAIQYLMRNWPLPKNGTIYNLISGTVSYLYKRKGVLVKGETGYTLKPHKDLSELINAPQLPPTPEEKAKRNRWSKMQYERTRAKRKATEAAELPFPPQEEPKASAQ